MLTCILLPSYCTIDYMEIWQEWENSKGWGSGEVEKKSTTGIGASIRDEEESNINTAEPYIIGYHKFEVSLLQLLRNVDYPTLQKTPECQRQKPLDKLPTSWTQCPTKMSAFCSSPQALFFTHNFLWLSWNPGTTLGLPRGQWPPTWDCLIDHRMTLQWSSICQSARNTHLESCTAQCGKSYQAREVGCPAEGHAAPCHAPLAALTHPTSLHTQQTSSSSRTAGSQTTVADTPDWMTACRLQQCFFSVYCIYVDTEIKALHTPFLLNQNNYYFIYLLIFILYTFEQFPSTAHYKNLYNYWTKPYF